MMKEDDPEKYKKVALSTPHSPEEEEEVDSLDTSSNAQDAEDEADYEYARGRKWCHRVLRCNRSVRRGFNLGNMDDIPEDEYSGYREGWRPVYKLIFESSTIQGQLFDLALLLLISISVVVAVLDSVDTIR